MDYKMDNMPPELKARVNMKLVQHHAPLLARFGLKHNKLETKLTMEERLLTAFYAVNIAYEEERFSRIPELSGLALYGFAAMGLFDLAHDFVQRSIDPQSGGTLDICVQFLLALALLEKIKQPAAHPGVMEFILTTRQVVSDYIGTYATELYKIGIILKKRERQNQITYWLAQLCKWASLLMIVFYILAFLNRITS